MAMVRAVFGNGIFRPLDDIDLPEGTVVEFEPLGVGILPANCSVGIPPANCSVGILPASEGERLKSVPDQPAAAIEIGTNAGRMPTLRGDAGKMPTLRGDAGKMPTLQEEGWKPVLQKFDPEADFDVRVRNLPHWRQEGAAYFVTFRLADSLPQVVLGNLKTQRMAWLKQHPKPISPASLRKYQELFSERIEQYLSAGYGACWLRQSAVADIVEGALRYFDRQRYSLGRYVIMPNHVHAIVLPWPANDLSMIAHSWKSFTANQINKVISRRGTLWQKEPFDHIVRDDEELDHFNCYIDDNPVKAHLSAGGFRLGCGSGIALP